MRPFGGKTLLSLLLLTLLRSSSVSGHIVKFFDKCPPIEAMKSFDLTKFTGTWYIIEVYSGVNKCMTMTFTKLSDTELEASQSREFAFLKSMNINRPYTYTGTLTVDNATMPSDMSVKWPANIMGSADFKVVDTDYSNYALTFECQNVWVMMRKSFSILSRKRTLDAETLNKLKKKITDAGEDPSHLTSVDQSNCENDERGTFEGSFDNNTFALLDDNQIQKINNTQDLVDYLRWKVPEDKKVDRATADPEAEPEPEPEHEPEPEPGKK